MKREKDEISHIFRGFGMQRAAPACPQSGQAGRGGGFAADCRIPAEQECGAPRVLGKQYFRAAAFRCEFQYSKYTKSRRFVCFFAGAATLREGNCLRYAPLIVSRRGFQFSVFAPTPRPAGYPSFAALLRFASLPLRINRRVMIRS